MATVTPQGVIPRDLTGYRALFETRFREAFGDDLVLKAESPAGEQVGIMASSAAELDEGLVSLSNAISVSRSVDLELDTHGELLDLRRRSASRSRVTLTLTGVAGTTVPARSRASTDAGVEFRTVASALIPSGGAINVVAESVDVGAIEVGPGQIRNIVTGVAGWETVTNAASAAPGIARETNRAYRARYFASTGRLARGPVDAIQAALIEAGATALRIERNETDADIALAGITLPAYSLLCVVQSGQDADIAAAIVKSKGLGPMTFGGTGTRQVTVGQIRFRRPEEVAVVVTVNIMATAEFLAAGIQQIKDNVVSYAAGTWAGGTGQFDTRGFRIGEGIDLRRLQSPINAIPGHEITSLTATAVGGGALPDPTPVDRLYTVTAENVVVHVTT